ncbi:MAG: glycosyltransferase [Myxococcota bacterium]|nr:glycosyltransferase [Myxococcota bacterium]
MVARGAVTPRLSILLPYRDVEPTIDEAIASVLEEREVPLELIAIDDGSRDGSAARVAAWAARDPRVIAITGEGAGIARALCRGAERARGAVIGRMDGDDVSLPGRFPGQLDRLAQDDALAVVGGLVEAFPASAVQGGLERYLEWQNALRTAEEHARDLFVEAPLCHPSVCLRREALEAVGGFREVDGPEDYDLWLRLDAAGWGLAKIDAQVLRWRQREGRLTFTDPRYSLERFRAVKATYLAPRLRAIGARSLACWGAGPTGRRLARALEREGVRFSRFVDIDPRKIGRIARGAPIVDADAIDPARDFVVVAVGAAGARALVRADLERRGFIEGRDFLCAS